MKLTLFRIVGCGLCSAKGKHAQHPDGYRPSASGASWSIIVIVDMHNHSVSEYGFLVLCLFLLGKW
ncbi:hypothetical protein [Paenibacillus phytorum]|uniref:hypothetical protein n=1 Tax=Paenibacillus phytorum TaxID=2654977 RepID=UPI001492F508|nr:hypothetical protein [Paenibacillus phytorum]